MNMREIVFSIMSPESQTAQVSRIVRVPQYRQTLIRYSSIVMSLALLESVREGPATPHAETSPAEVRAFVPFEVPAEMAGPLVVLELFFARSATDATMTAGFRSHDKRNRWGHITFRADGTGTADLEGMAVPIMWRPGTNASADEVDPCPSSGSSTA